jgi:hypothetical protein
MEVNEVMSNRLSYSQIRLYSECGQKYAYYYRERLRERTKSGALLFGSAFDKAIESVHKNRDANEFQVFDEVFTNQEINGRVTYLPDCTLVVYAASDFDADLLKEEDLTFLNAKAKELLPELYAELGGDIREIATKCATYKKQRAFRKMREEEVKFHNLANWFSLRRKGHLMLHAHRKEVLPMISKVHGTQVKVELANDTGDTLIGYVDLVCELYSVPEKVIIDYKTSSIEYEADSVATSPQLTIYSHALDIKKCGYFVFRKGILKNKVKKCIKCGFDGSGGRSKTCNNEVDGDRCHGAWVETIDPKVDIQIIVAEIPARTEEIILQNVNEINKAISQGIFIRNLGSCHGAFGACPYLSLCFRNEMGDVEKV